MSSNRKTLFGMLGKYKRWWCIIYLSDDNNLEKHICIVIGKTGSWGYLPNKQKHKNTYWYIFPYQRFQNNISNPSISSLNSLGKNLRGLWHKQNIFYFLFYITGFILLFSITRSMVLYCFPISEQLFSDKTSVYYLSNKSLRYL